MAAGKKGALIAPRFLSCATRFTCRLIEEPLASDQTSHCRVGSTGRLTKSAPVAPPTTITSPPRDFGRRGAPTTYFCDPDGSYWFTDPPLAANSTRASRTWRAVLPTRPASPTRARRMNCVARVRVACRDAIRRTGARRSRAAPAKVATPLLRHAAKRGRALLAPRAVGML
jgi:hypothetical protein